MDDNVPKENPPDSPPADFNKIDLSQLQGFSFGTQWTQDKGTSAPDRRDRSEGRPRRDGGDAPDRRDRRAFKRPDAPPAEGAPGEGRPPGAGDVGPPRREYGGDRRPRGEGREFRGGPRGPGGDRERQMHGGYAGRGPGAAAHEPRAPYDSPYFSVTFYPEDTSFNALVKTVRASCRTIELFEIARTVLGKPERFTVLLTRRDPNAPRPGVPARQSAPAAEAPSPPESAPAAPAKEPVYLSVPDNLPFETEEAAIAHVLSKHLGLFFDSAEVEVEPPKGNFQVINRCGVTGELLGPPNYHRYNQIVQQHYAAKAIRMPFEAYKARIESVRDPEAVAKWLEKMKKVTRYTSKLPAPEGQTPPTFDTWEDARTFLLAAGKDKLVRPSGHARFHGRTVESLPPGEIRRAVEGTLERQRRFPLDTANALRGRLRREHFTIFKKGAKGISYVCAVKRKFRTPGQTFAQTIGTLIQFIENHPMVKAGELPKRFLGLAPEAPASAEGGAPALADVLSVEQREKIARLQGDLLWLVREGYVTEFIDGSLYAPPPVVEARRKEVEHEDNDPENFPERPAGNATEAVSPGSESGGESAAGAEAPAPASPPESNAAGEGEGISGQPPEAPAESSESTTAPAEPVSPSAAPEGGDAHHRSAEDTPVAPQSEQVSEHSSAS